MKNKITITILMVAVFIIGVGLGMKFNRSIMTESNTVKVEQQETNTRGLAKNPVKVKRVLKESTKDFHLDKGDIATEYTDGSYTIENNKTKTYVFQPAVLGDWDYKVKNKEELNKIVETYLNIQNEGSY